MSTGVVQALFEYETRLHSLGAAVIAELRPGLSPEQIVAIEVEYDVRLSQDARAIWAWHDGTTPSSARGTHGQLTPYSTFVDLRRSIDLGRTVAASTNPILIESGAGFLSRQPEWLTVTHDNKIHLIVDCAAPDQESSRTASWVAGASLDSAVQLPTAHRVNWWNWALEHGAWTVEPDGSWRIHRARYPQGPGMHDILV